ncbi:SDR family oxidoreductase [Undibacterium fentianense]|uniref:SDR family oxidoreductase n=1 Tax=Undibacterium fentianense TaxID=2828728 RepID=A0A941IGD1_9BURK|nr:SDR family oxidoreductase [Undibacterium fentianense]MBR7799890.1 SDR family oxidoreductase [Undibacterium fentianense]
MSEASSTRVALITGAARRIGRQIALALARQGWDIVVHYGRSEIEARKVVEEIENLGQRATCIQAELGDEVQIRSIVPAAMAIFGRLDCVVNNASLFEGDSAKDFTSASLDKHMHANLMAPIILAQDLYSVQPSGCVAGMASVINILDQKLFNLNPDYLSYTLSKAALQTSTVMLAQALAPKLRVVGIAPGLSMVSGEQSASDFEAAHRITPLGRSSLPEDIAEAVCYAANAKAVTGSTLIVDGGQHLIPTQRDVMFLATAQANQKETF